MKNTTTITKEQFRKMEGQARRNEFITSGLGAFKHKAHKSAKDYNRKREKKVIFDYKKLYNQNIVLIFRL